MWYPIFQAFRILRSCQKMLNRKHHGDVFVREILCLKINSQKILENSKIASNFCFHCSEKLIF